MRASFWLSFSLCSLLRAHSYTLSACLQIDKEIISKLVSDANRMFYLHPLTALLSLYSNSHYDLMLLNSHVIVCLWNLPHVAFVKTCCITTDNNRANYANWLQTQIHLKFLLWVIDLFIHLFLYSFFAHAKSCCLYCRSFAVFSLKNKIEWKESEWLFSLIRCWSKKRQFRIMKIAVNPLLTFKGKPLPCEPSKFHTN